MHAYKKNRVLPSWNVQNQTWSRDNPGSCFISYISLEYFKRSTVFVRPLDLWFSESKIYFTYSLFLYSFWAKGGYNYWSLWENMLKLDFHLFSLQAVLRFHAYWLISFGTYWIPTLTLILLMPQCLFKQELQDSR